MRYALGMLSEVERRVVEALSTRRERMLADLAAWVALPTGPGGGAIEELRSILCRRAEALGARVEFVNTEARPDWLYREPGERASGRVPATAICRCENARGGARFPLLISGHLDTVHTPSPEFGALRISPDGQRGLGPGCSDMKGGLVLAVHALETLREAGVHLDWTLILNADEETGSFGSARAIQREAARVASAGGWGLALEPSLPDGSIVTQRAGSGQFMIEARGKSAHAGRDFAKGASAVVALARAIDDAAQLPEPELNRIVNFGPLLGGTTTNSVPDLARAWGNIRFANAADAEALVRALKSICQSNERGPGGTSLELQHALARPAKEPLPRTRRLAELIRAAGADLGQTIAFVTTGGVCDGNLMQAEGLATIDTLGVRGGGLHTREEWVDLSGLVERAALLAVTMLRAAQTA